jgi:ketosteroid isomerase-like protein
MTRARCLSLIVCLTVVLPDSSAAQAWPGGRGSLAAKQRNDYLAFVREGVDELVARFERAAGEHDAGKLAQLYTDAATLVTPTGTVFGRGPVRDRFERALPRMRAVKLRIETVTASGDLAYAGGRMSYEVTHANGAHAYDVPVALVLEQHRQNSWRIQSQVGGELPVFVMALRDSSAAPAAAPTLAVLVTDASGNPVPDVLVAFEIDAGSAALLPTAASTNARGIATTTLTRTTPAERVVVRATASALTGEPVIFTLDVAEVAGKEGAKAAASPTGSRGEQ